MLSQEKIDEVCRLLDSGKSPQAVSQVSGVSIYTIRYIQRGLRARSGRNIHEYEEPFVCPTHGTLLTSFCVICAARQQQRSGLPFEQLFPGIDHSDDDLELSPETQRRISWLQYMQKLEDEENPPISAEAEALWVDQENGVPSKNSVQ